MPIPSVDELKRPTLECLRRGVTKSSAMREELARAFRLTDLDLGKQLSNRMPRFTNNHAWALVRLQQEDLIRKLLRGGYALTDAGRKALAAPAPPQQHRLDPPRLGRMPPWAKLLVNGANRRNGPVGPRFAEEDLMALWQDCGGRCKVTGLEFSEEKVGQGAAKRAFAPSLDRIDPAGPYSRENCRLVMVAVNFAMNAWGDEVYLRLARAAVATAQDSADEIV